MPEKTRPHQYPQTKDEIDANDWEEVSAEHYHAALNALPPARWIGGAFAVGEPMNDSTEGTVYMVYVRDGERYYCRPLPIKPFEPERYREQIREQLARRCRNFRACGNTVEAAGEICGLCLASYVD